MPREAQAAGLALPDPAALPDSGVSPATLWLHASCVELAGTGVIL